ncbi:uncharacterized protein BDZ99DRAFT_565531 [Mytilinidion resinicola]|uniref:Uncharacterized protein n=1 Tax=Mytilinidion resinicola TaxID=574789 RepID=A0A6A6ZAE8_9PEZI|nr:uncharacterized protein BDZ99DRAFT_565531 [Mytilinidion resinicola]KAF2817996.1 hypothetical protein BDZ99DRAFT_565531 [Mytilinidion resinicola]
MEPPKRRLSSGLDRTPKRQRQEHPAPSKQLILLRHHQTAVHTYVKRAWLLDCPGEIVDTICTFLERNDFLTFRSASKILHQKTLFHLNNRHLKEKRVFLSPTSRRGLGSLVELVDFPEFARRVHEVTLYIRDCSFLWASEIYGEAATRPGEGRWAQHFNHTPMELGKRAVDQALLLICLQKLPELEYICFEDFPESSENGQEDLTCATTSAVSNPNGDDFEDCFSPLLRDVTKWNSFNADPTQFVVGVQRVTTSEPPLPGAFVNLHHCNKCEKPARIGQCIHLDMFVRALTVMAVDKDHLFQLLHYYDVPACAKTFTMTHIWDDARGALSTQTSCLNLREIRHLGSVRLPELTHKPVYFLLRRLWKSAPNLEILYLGGQTPNVDPPWYNGHVSPHEPWARTFSATHLRGMGLTNVLVHIKAVEGVLARYAGTLTSLVFHGAQLVRSSRSIQNFLGTLRGCMALEHLYWHAVCVVQTDGGHGEQLFELEGVDAVCFGDEESCLELATFFENKGGMGRWAWCGLGVEVPEPERRRDITGWLFEGEEVVAEGVAWMQAEVGVLGW